MQIEEALSGSLMVVIDTETNQIYLKKVHSGLRFVISISEAIALGELIGTRIERVVSYRVREM